jgi:hypothetical protein
VANARLKTIQKIEVAFKALICKSLAAVREAHITGKLAIGGGITRLREARVNKNAI